MYEVYDKKRITESLRDIAHNDLEKVAMAFEELRDQIEPDLLLPAFESACKAKVWKRYDRFKGTEHGDILLWIFERADWDAVIYEVFCSHFAD